MHRLFISFRDDQSRGIFTEDLQEKGQGELIISLLGGIARAATDAPDCLTTEAFRGRTEVYRRNQVLLFSLNKADKGPHK